MAPPAPHRTCLAALFLSVLAAGCTRLPPPCDPPRILTGRETGGFEGIADTFRRSTDLAACRGALQQLNADLARRPHLKPPALGDQEQRFLREQLQCTDDEIDEIASNSFTLLDGHYLEQCFLLRDAAQALPAGKAETRIQAAFAWVTRQVRLVDGQTEPSPAAHVLRRGWGSDRDRVVVFLALLDQLDVLGCMVAVADKNALYPWLPGAVVGKDVLLFDTRLGGPLPGPDNQGYLTLAALRRQPDVVRQLSVYNYDVTPEQAARLEVHVVSPLSALSPRMHKLQHLLNFSGVQLAQNPVARLASLRKTVQALPGAPMEVRFWSGRDWAAPGRLLRSFLPPEEGGADATRERQRKYELSLTSLSALPRRVEALSEKTELGARMRDQFEQPFIDFMQRAGEPRDLLLRGRYDEAVQRLIQKRDEIDQLRGALRQQPELEVVFNEWCARAELAQQELLVAQQRAEKQRTAETGLALEKAKDQMNQSWLAWVKQPASGPDWQRHPRRFLLGTSQAPIAVEAAYLLALAKLEQAEQVQAAETGKQASAAVDRAWQAALEWWQKYLDDDPPTATRVAAQLGRARALEGLGRRDAAIAGLEGVQAEGWNKAAVRYRIDRLKTR